MFLRWFLGAYGVAVLTGFATAPWVFSEGNPIVLGLFFIPFALPYVLVACLLAWGLQRSIERLMPPGWQRTAYVASVAAVVGSVGIFLTTGTRVYVLIAAVSAVAGALLAEDQRAWLNGWLVVTGAAGLDSLLIIGLSIGGLL